jgi:hypothetical protein
VIAGYGSNVASASIIVKQQRSYNTGGYSESSLSSGNGVKTETGANGETVIIVDKPYMDNSTGIAKVEVSKDIVDNAIKKAHPGQDGVKTVVINIPQVSGANGYEMSLPSGFLAAGDTTKEFVIKTDFASVTMPGNMLETIAVQGTQNVSLAIASGDKTKLDTDIQAQIGSRPVIELSLKIDGKPISWSNQSAPVTVSIEYTPTAEELKDTEHITVWYIDGSGKVVSVPSGRYYPATGMMTFVTTHFSHYAVAYVTRTFDDLGSVDWAKKTIEVLASKGVLKGASEKEYAPQTIITRADFLYFLVKTLSLDAKVDGNFGDVSTEIYYYREIAIAKKLAITDGTGNNKFNPDAKITRQDMIVLTERALRLLQKLKEQGDISDLDKFADKSLIATYAVNSIGTVVKEGLVVGDRDMLNPLGNATRAEAAVFLYRIYNKY